MNIPNITFPNLYILQYPSLGLIVISLELVSSSTLNRLSNKLDNLYGFKLFSTGTIDEINVAKTVFTRTDLGDLTWGFNPLEVIVAVRTIGQFPWNYTKIAKFAFMHTHQNEIVEIYNYGKGDTIISGEGWNPSIKVTAKHNKMSYSIYIMKLINN